CEDRPAHCDVENDPQLASTAIGRGEWHPRQRRASVADGCCGRRRDHAHGPDAIEHPPRAEVVAIAHRPGAGRSDARGPGTHRPADASGGWRPRDAAYGIAAIWLLAVVSLGVVEHLVDPKTFDTVWLGMWWGVETVTTVGYGDVVPHDTVGKVIAS